ncbi:succinyl-diaminopimelate desuccinylase [Glycomyces halotolerans]
MTVLSEAVLADPVQLTRALCDIQSVSGDEAAICDAVEHALDRAGHLTVRREGNTLVARTELGLGRRVMLAGHLDTVPVNGNFPTHTEGDVMWGLGTSDMKSGTALALWIAATVAKPRFDLSFAFYDCEEVDSARNGLNKLSKSRPEWLGSDFAILLEPTYGMVEAGCQGTMRAKVTARGRRAHSARSWKGENAVHKIAPALERLGAYRARQVEVDGCAYREGLNAVGIGGGVAGNVIPDECWVEVNYRFAPDRDEKDAEEHLREVFDGFEVELTDSAPSCRPGLDRPEAAEFVEACGGRVRAKLGWTDVARFATLGIPAVNYGPGDPNLAHKQDERVEVPLIGRCADALRAYVEGS